MFCMLAAGTQCYSHIYTSSDYNNYDCLEV